MKFFRIIFLLIVILLISSCVIIPLPNDPPFPENSLVQLSSKNANKILVRKLFGKPKVIKNGGKYWFYAVRREVAGVIAGGGVIEDNEWLAIHFDESDKVVFYEFNDDLHGCMSNGICHLKGLFSEPANSSVITAAKSDDILAKNYQVKSNECAIYFYQDPIFRIRAGNYPVTFTVDKKLIGSVNYESYLFLTSAPGKIHINAYQFEIKVECIAGKKLYIQAKEGGTVKKGRDLAPVQASTGIKEILKRRLALPD